jgi:hypothetical protein
MAFDGSRIFRVLYYLSQEPASFMLAQDAFPSIDRCLTQLRDVSESLSFYKDMVTSTEDTEVAASYVTLIGSAEALLSRTDEIMPVLQELANRAVVFWYCCPMDQSATSSKEYNQRWVDYKGGAPIGPEHTALMVLFKTACLAAVDLLFADLLVKLKADEAEDERQLRSLPTEGSSKLLHTHSIMCDLQTTRNQNTFVSSCMFPVTHYHVVDPAFGRLLGYSIPKLLSIPIFELGVNNMALDIIMKGLNNNEGPLTSTLIYRTASGDLVTVHWDICATPVNGSFTGIGTNISKEIEISKHQQSGNIQRMLRQWLHSIRNASFEQQAVVLRDEITVLRGAMRDAGEHHAAFDSITSGLNTLIHTAKTSVGLIDQALETKGLIHLMSVGDFLNNLSNFPRNFAISEGIGSIPIKIDMYLDGVCVLPTAVSDLFVRCDVVSVQAFVDNLISNAVR